MRLILLFAFISILGMASLQGQMRIDGNFPFQSDPSKDYSLYIPSGYSAGTPNGLMLGMHPFNTARWDAVSWCDTLIDFAEANGLILACPDGGSDGNITDQIDTAFTTALLDSVYSWYNIDMDRIYIMGFSMGGRATYTYGLSHPEVFGGLLPIGAAITGTNEVNTSLQGNSSCKAVYIVHGSFDSPNNRYYPVLNALTSSGALINSLLMPGVGHTIDFPNRNQILTDAFTWIDSVNANTAPAPVSGFTFSTSMDSVFFSDNSSNAVAWSWDFGDGASDSTANPQHVYTQSGTYTVCLTVSNASGCTSTHCESVQVVITDVQDGLESSITAYPVPADQFLTLSFGEVAHEDLLLTLTDLQGRKVAKYSIGEGISTYQIDLSQFRPGHYLATMMVNGNLWRAQIPVLR